MTEENDSFLDNVFDKIIEYVDGQFSNQRVGPNINPTSMQRVSDLKLPHEGLGRQQSLEDIDVYMKNSIRTHAPGFMNPLWGGMSIVGTAGDLIATVTNNSMYTQELSPFATLIEIELIKKACELIGYPDGFGSFTSGGSNGNLLGLLCARKRLIPNSVLNGFDGSKHVIFVSSEAHYSTLMAANVVGIGHSNVMKIRCDSMGRMDVNHLQEEIDYSLREGFTPLCVVATSGTTVRGAFDPISDIVSICSQYDLWCHVDAAWGGMALLSPAHRRLIDGIEDADSVCWDAHKMMGLPLMSSMFIIKNPRVLRDVCSHTGVADYLFFKEGDSYDLGHFSLQCTRRNDALKLWLAWREVGDAGWARLLSGYMKLADYLEQQIHEHPDLELKSGREWTNVCFRFNPTSSSMVVDELNNQIRERLKFEGNFIVSRATIQDEVVLRSVIANNATKKEHIDGFIASVVRIGNEIINDIPASQ